MPDVFTEYEGLITRADRAFREMSGRYPSNVKCAPRCSDCCHAVFGLFFVEASSLKDHFEKLERKERRQTILRANKADRDMERLMLQSYKAENDGGRGTYAPEKLRVRCPLLNGADECVLYVHRPITCRVYGIPTAIQGKAHVCWKAEFEEGASYPAFDLDAVNRKLYRLSLKLLEEAGKNDPSKALLLVSVSRAITTPTRDLIRDVFV